MSDDDEEAESEPAVELGDGPDVAGAPVARIASRMHWPQERSSLERKVGDETIRTPDGPRELSAVLDELDTSYFERRQEFVAAVREAVGTGPVATE
jgi:hypothetical protein